MLHLVDSDILLWEKYITLMPSIPSKYSLQILKIVIISEKQTPLEHLRTEVLYQKISIFGTLQNVLSSI